MKLNKAESLQAEIQRLNPAELLYPDNFECVELIEHLPTIRRRPEWEFELGTCRALINATIRDKRLSRLWH